MQDGLLLEKLEERRQEFVVELKQLLIDEQKDRTDKEQSKTPYKVWSDKGFVPITRIIRHKTHKKIFRIVTNSAICDVTEDHSLIDIDGEIIKPSKCEIGTKLLHAFPDEKLLKDSMKLDNYNVSGIINSSKIICMTYYYVSKKLDYNVQITIPDDQKQEYFLKRTKAKIDDPNKIIKIIQLNDLVDDYVYDLETDNGHFHAGIGSLIVHNTDSIVINQ